MSHIKTLRLLATASAVLLGGSAAAQQAFTIDLGSSRVSGSGAANLLVENIRVTQGGQQVGYNVLFKLDPATLDLIPEVISQSAGVGASNCAAVTVTVYNAALGSASTIRAASVTVGTRSAYTGTTGVANFTGATEGAASVLVTAAGFSNATQAANFSCTGTNAVSVGLTPIQ
jgi:hypothetical protein